MVDLNLVDVPLQLALGVGNVPPANFDLNIDHELHQREFLQLNDLMEPLLDHEQPNLDLPLMDNSSNITLSDGSLSNNSEDSVMGGGEDHNLDIDLNAPAVDLQVPDELQLQHQPVLIETEPLFLQLAAPVIAANNVPQQQADLLPEPDLFLQNLDIFVTDKQTLDTQLLDEFDGNFGGHSSSQAHRVESTLANQSLAVEDSEIVALKEATAPPSVPQKANDNSSKLQDFALVTETEKELLEMSNAELAASFEMPPALPFELEPIVAGHITEIPEQSSNLGGPP